MSEELPRFVRDMLSSPPAAGAGVHRWMFSTSRYLHAFRTEDEIHEILSSTLHGCGRVVPSRELMAAIRDSKKSQWVKGQKNEIAYQSAWPKVDTDKYAEITKQGLGAYDLWESSPVRFMDDKAYTEVIIEELFAGNPYLCCGLSSTVFASKRKVEWMGDLEKQQFIVPSACTGETGLTKEGKKSAHCLSNVGPRQYLVIEQDMGSQDQQVSIIQYLSKYLPMCMVLSSGGKSLHAWFECLGQKDELLLRFMKLAVSLGADDATWVKSQFVRMPDGLRDNGNRQSVLYFNPKNE